MAHTVVVTDVPAEDVDQVVADYQSEGATVSKMLQENNKYTVTATFPDAEAVMRAVMSKNSVIQHALLTFRKRGK